MGIQVRSWSIAYLIKKRLSFKLGCKVKGLSEIQGKYLAFFRGCLIFLTVFESGALNVRM